MIYHQIFSSLIASKSLKLSFTLNCVLKHANGLKTIQMNSFCFRPASEILKPFLVNGNRSRTRQTQNRDIINIILISFFSVRTVNYGSLFFPLGFMASALRAWAMNRRGKNSVRNLRYEPRTRLARGVYISTWRKWGLQARSTMIRNDTESVTLVSSLLYILFKIWGAVQASHYNPA